MGLDLLVSKIWGMPGKFRRIGVVEERKCRVFVGEIDVAPRHE